MCGRDLGSTFSYGGVLDGTVLIVTAVLASGVQLNL